MGDILQDTLRLLTIWFNNGDNDKLNDEMEKGLREVSVDTWLVVIPQVSHSEERSDELRIREFNGVTMRSDAALV